MFKKILLLLIGGGAASAGFLYYVNLPQDESEALAQRFSEQKINLKNIAADIAQSDVVQQAISKGKEHLIQAPQTQQWLAKMVQSYAKQSQGETLSDEASEQVVDVLMQVRQLSEQLNQQQLEGAKPLNEEQRQHFTAVMAQGDEVLQQHLGVSVAEFLSGLNKSPLQPIGSE